MCAPICPALSYRIYQTAHPAVLSLAKRSQEPVLAPGSYDAVEAIWASQEQLETTVPPLHQHQSLRVFSWNPEGGESQEEGGGVGRGGDKEDSSSTHLWATVVLTLQQGDVGTTPRASLMAVWRTPLLDFLSGRK